MVENLTPEETAAAQSPLRAEDRLASAISDRIPEADLRRAIQYHTDAILRSLLARLHSGREVRPC